MSRIQPDETVKTARLFVSFQMKNDKLVETACHTFRKSPERPSFYQDRLGTNTKGKRKLAEGKTAI
jgi:hypothetical protein